MTNILRFLTLFAALAGSTALRAQDSIQLPWNQICNYANSSIPHKVQLTTTAGETVEGSCFSVTVDEIQITTKTGLMTVARAQLSRVRMYQTEPRRHLAHLGKDVRAGLAGSVSMIPTEWGPVGLIGIPATLAWGAVASPFCLLGDIIGYTKTTEIKIK
jgi:hypothetical protein